MTGSWRARFVGPDGLAELPVFATIAERRLVKEEGALSDAPTDCAMKLDFNPPAVQRVAPGP